MTSTPEGATPPSADTAAWAEATIDWLLRRACVGVAMLDSAYALADHYRDRRTSQASGFDPRAAAHALARWEMSKSFTTGFVTGMAGIVALPVALPGGLAISILLQGRMVAAIAVLFDHDLHAPDVRKRIRASLEAGHGPEQVRRAGASMGQWATQAAMLRLGPKVWQRLDARLLQRMWPAGRLRRGRLLSVGRALPLVGAMVSGGTDALSCRRVARAAIEEFGTAH